MKDAELLFSRSFPCGEGLDFRTWSEGGPRDVCPYYMIARQLAIFPLLPFCPLLRQRGLPHDPTAGRMYAGPQRDPLIRGMHPMTSCRRRIARSSPICASRNNPSVVITRKPAVSQLRVTGSATPRRLPRPARARVTCNDAQAPIVGAFRCCAAFSKRFFQKSHDRRINATANAFISNRPRQGAR